MDADPRTLERRASVHAALADVTRLKVVDLLARGDASPSWIGDALGIPANLLAHHLKVLERAGVVARHRSEGDARRIYVRLLPAGMRAGAAPALPGPHRVLFVCTANSARSHLATALWTRASKVATASAGTHPSDRVHPGAIAAARRHALPLRRPRPRHVDDVALDSDLVITVCDRAREEIGARATLHWSVPDPVRIGTDDAFDAALTDLAARIEVLAPRLVTDS